MKGLPLLTRGPFATATCQVNQIVMRGQECVYADVIGTPAMMPTSSMKISSSCLRSIHAFMAAFIMASSAASSEVHTRLFRECFESFSCPL